MRPIGFSTGALAKGDFERGLRLQADLPEVRAVELSALRDHELPALAKAAAELALFRFQYVSVHAPSKLGTLGELAIFELLKQLPAAWPIVVHPEILQSPELWRSLGSRLCIENMDNRKTAGRTVPELRRQFEIFPEASFCLDVGHAQQIDPTMAVAILMLLEFGPRLRQLHVSEVGPKGEHRALGAMAKAAYSRLASHVPESCPIIIESVIAVKAIAAEFEAISRVFDQSLVEAHRSFAFG
ncbi:MAG: hypothetical protein ABIQ65_00020 [Thermoanaerobaculia bacterium]